MKILSSPLINGSPSYHSPNHTGPKEDTISINESRSFLKALGYVVLLPAQVGSLTAHATEESGEKIYQTHIGLQELAKRVVGWVSYKVRGVNESSQENPSLGEHRPAEQV